MKLLLLAALASGCAPRATEAIVTLSNHDLTVPTDIDTIHIEVHQVDAAGPLLSSADVKPCAPGEQRDGCKTFPFTVLFVPGDQVDTRAWVSFRALSSGTKVIDNAFVLAFVRGYTLRYDLVLYAVCKQSHCADQGEVCKENGLCAPLAPVNSPDLGAPADLAVADLALAPVDGPLPPRRIFLTAATTFGTFGGLAGGRALCNTEAKAAGLVGNFTAILGLSTLAPNRYLVLDGGSRPIVRLDGMPVATDATFWQATHSNPINVGANGVLVPPTNMVDQNAWTGFDHTGAQIPAGTCGDWTATGTGFFGDPHGVVMNIPGSWAKYAAQGNCSSNFPCHLYCIEQ